MNKALGTILVVFGFVPLLFLVGPLFAAVVVGLRRARLEFRDGHYILVLVILFIVAWWSLLAVLVVLAYLEWVWKQISN